MISGGSCVVPARADVDQGSQSSPLKQAHHPVQDHRWSRDRSGVVQREPLLIRDTSATECEQRLISEKTRASSDCSCLSSSIQCGVITDPSRLVVMPAVYNELQRRKR